MPIVNVNMWKGFGEEPAKRLIKGITDVFVDIGIPAEAVQVVIYQIPKTHWGIGGEPASEKFKDVAVE